MEYVKFVVDETPYCFWDSDISDKNINYLNWIDCDYYKYVAKIHSESLESEDKHRAAIALRAAYIQGLEVLFALLCTAVQSPNCVFGWMLSYKKQ